METGKTVEPGREAREVELALLVTPVRLDRLRQHFALAKALDAAPKSLRTIYYDTAEFGLQEMGLALRVREQAGAFTQTIKTWGEAAGGLKDRREVNAPIPTADPDPSKIPDAQMRKAVTDGFAKAPVGAIFETAFERCKAEVTLPCGSVIEVAVDRGGITSDRLCLPLHEVELELIKGRPAALFEMGTELAALVPLRVGVQSKADRGYGLVQDRVPEAVKAKPAALGSGLDAEAAFGQCLRDALMQFLVNEPVVMESRAEEGVHQMRVALRRLRALLTIYRPIFGKEALAGLNSKAKSLADALGKVRDLDVVRHDIVEPVLKRAKKRSGLELLLDRLEARREAAWEHLLSDLESSGEAARFALELGRDIEAAFWRRGRDASAFHQPITDFARTVLDKRARSVRKKAKGLAHLSIEDRHRLRIEVKKLRYACGFFGALFPAGERKNYERILAKLQDSFGALNDVEVAKQVLPRLAAGGSEPTLVEAVSEVIAWHEKQAAKDWDKTQTRFAKWEHLVPFWQSDE